MSTTLSAVLADLDLSQRDVVRGTGLSRSVVSRIVAHYEWPAKGAAQFCPTSAR